ncbi:nucleotidyltransferase family protein [Sphingoaurantiacus capsulatus]|uniref:Nucleotidyltransferase family protein n=1 Tax=Sphingoaurantiacus capsulatus TaxID=1771310 RepID=A0ABV7XAI5_9SPHN
MADLSLLVDHLREPSKLTTADATTWERLLRMARREALIGQFAMRVREAGITPPPLAQTILDDAMIGVETSQRSARWEARDAARLLGGRGYPVALMKGAAYVVADLPPAEGRTVGDLDILVPRAAIDDAESVLRANGWDPLKDEGYDDAYYRQWMHEIPPLAHAERGSVIDVHHTILPLTARLRPDAEALIADAVPVGDGLHMLSPPDMLLHSVAHLFYDGDFDGGLRNLWDIHRLITGFDTPDFWRQLAERARLHQLEVPLARALRFARDFYGTKVNAALAGQPTPLDRLIRRRLTARDGYGLPIRPLTRQALYIRGHWLRMPPALLARHLFTKWRMRRAGEGPG